ncbi:MAG: NAD(+) synthase [Oscillospiraceae bacterium]|nr:NAD(+) synthase [Oscillospiraceae bacterium]
MAYTFNAEKAANACIDWIRDWFEKNGKDCNAVLGISGGKDSSVTAALLVKALGKERVIGVLMPQGEQFDIGYSRELCEILDIRNIEVNIGETVEALKKSLGFEPSVATLTNIPPRVRMTVLYAIAQSNNGRVANTCNLSEDWVGYATLYGDGAGDFGPISNFTVQEVKAIGRYLGLPEKFIKKPPLDGLCGKTDEDNLGFTYKALDDYIRLGIEPELDVKAKIDRLNRLNQFKLKRFDTFLYTE